MKPGWAPVRVAIPLALVALALTLLPLFAMTLAKEHTPTPSEPDRLAIGRDTFFDFGPPFDYVELFLIRPNGTGTSIERVILTPGYKCLLPARVEVAKAAMKQSVADLLGGNNPCTIPERDLAQEATRRKPTLVFSGENVAMQVRCGRRTRIIRSAILDKDMFDPRAATPVYTSWTMGILAQIDRAFGGGTADRPMITLPGYTGGSAQPLDSPVLQEIAKGRYDRLFPGAAEKPSRIYSATRKTLPAPSVRLVKSSPVKPILAPLPQYPAIAREAGVEGTFTFTADVSADGRIANFAVENGAPLLRAAMEVASRGWKFPKQSAGGRVTAIVLFSLNCRLRK